MKFNEYIKKVYTFAFRLTGEETTADDVASLAINRNINSLDEDIDSRILHRTAKEVCSIYLLEPDKYNKTSFVNHNNTVQNTLLNLEPLSRAIVVWKDIMGFNLNDLEAASNCPKSELYKKLNNARKQLLTSGTVGTYTDCHTI